MKNQRELGAILSYVHIALTSLLGVIYTPVIIRFLGQSEFGLYALISSIAGYLSVLQISIGDTSVRYIAQNRVTNQNSAAVLNVLFLTVYIFLGILVLICGYLLYGNVELFFGETLNSDELQRFKLMVLIVTVGLAVSFPLNFFSSVLQAYEKFIFIRCNDILKVLLNPLIALPFLFWGYGAVTIVVILIFLNVAGLLVNTFYCMKYLKISFSHKGFTIPFLKEIIWYSFWIFLMILMDQIYWSSGQFVIGSLYGSMEIAIYAVAMQIVIMFIYFSRTISNLLLPKVSMMVAENASPADFSDMMTRVGRLQYLLLGYLFVMFLLVGKDFLYLWAGGNYIAAYPTTALLMGTMLIPLIQDMGVNILKAMNLHRYYTILCFSFAIMGVLASIPLASYYGYWGCAVAMSLAVFVSMGIIMNLYYARRLHIDICGFWRQIFFLSGAMILLFMLGNTWKYIMDAPIGWVPFFMECLFDTIIYIAIAYFWFMNSDERNLCNRVFLSITCIIKLRRKPHD